MFVAMTHNLWGTHRWPERQPALEAFLRARAPEIYAVQELTPAMRKVIDAELSGHDRVDHAVDDGGKQNDIWWDRRAFELVDHGAPEIDTSGRIQPPVSRLVWVRLNALAEESTLVVATAHFSYSLNSQEVAEHVNPRIAQSETSLSILDEVTHDDEPCLFMGDLNEAWHTLRILHAGGLTDSFSALRMIPGPTCPVAPTRWADPKVRELTGHHAPRVIDFQLHRGPLRPVLCEVIDFFEGDLAPSDHRPVATAYAFT